MCIKVETTVTMWRASRRDDPRVDRGIKNPAAGTPRCKFKQPRCWTRAPIDARLHARNCTHATARARLHAPIRMYSDSARSPLCVCIASAHERATRRRSPGRRGRVRVTVMGGESTKKRDGEYMGNDTPPLLVHTHTTRFGTRRLPVSESIHPLARAVLVRGLAVTPCATPVLVRQKEQPWDEISIE